MLSQTAVFTQRVREHLDPAEVMVAPDTSCEEVVSRLRETRVSAAIIVDPEQTPLGILTEQDISRRIAFLVGPETPVEAVMSTPVHTIDADDFLHHAVAGMRRDGIRHMPVVDAGHVIGMLELDHVLAQVSGQTVAQIDLLGHAFDPESMRATKRNQYRIAAEMMANEVPAADIQQLLSRLNHQLYRDAVHYVLGRMTQPPPVAFEVLIMGSGGRGESYLQPDQDNGLILEDYPDSDHGHVDPWFIEFSEHLTATLDTIGFDYCKGNVMATNPLWRKTLSQWRAQVSRWIGKSEGQALRLSDIFFDFVGVYGDGRMTAALRDHVTRNAARPFFLREMFKIDEEHEVALGPFGLLLTERRRGPDKGKLNLKMTGTLPLVGAIRILALRHGVSETGTLGRIAMLHEHKVLSHDEQDALTHAYRHIAHLLLRQQLRDSEAGLVPGNYVSPKSLSRRELDLLKRSFRAIKTFRKKLRTELTGELF